jgi:hypothetical protein
MNASVSVPDKERLSALIHVVLEYMWDEEFESFQEYIAEGGNPEEHVFWTLIQLRDICGFQSEFDNTLPVYVESEDDDEDEYGDED